MPEKKPDSISNMIKAPISAPKGTSSLKRVKLPRKQIKSYVQCLASDCQGRASTAARIVSLAVFVLISWQHCSVFAHFWRFRAKNLNFNARLQCCKKLPINKFGCAAGALYFLGLAGGGCAACFGCTLRVRDKRAAADGATQ